MSWFLCRVNVYICFNDDDDDDVYSTCNKSAYTSAISLAWDKSNFFARSDRVMVVIRLPDSCSCNQDAIRSSTLDKK